MMPLFYNFSILLSLYTAHILTGQRIEVVRLVQLTKHKRVLIANPLLSDVHHFARLKTLYAGSESLQRFRFGLRSLIQQSNINKMMNFCRNVDTL